jgi:nicotinamide riboside kinase
VATIGLIGFPNVGKSSTINAVFGSKKTAVAATPGKTKHFQTLRITEELMLCDCPGLVLPRFATSKAAMVAAGACRCLRTHDVRSDAHRDQLWWRLNRKGSWLWLHTLCCLAQAQTNAAAAAPQ